METGSGMERQYSSEFEQLEKKISYTFKDKEFLLLALTHSTYAYEHRRFGLVSNQRLEFLGDAILDFIVGEEMYKRKEDWNEGKLSKTRALVVCEKTLSKEAEKLVKKYFDLYTVPKKGAAEKKSFAGLMRLKKSYFPVFARISSRHLPENWFSTIKVSFWKKHRQSMRPIKLLFKWYRKTALSMTGPLKWPS